MKKFILTTALTAFMFGGAALAEMPKHAYGDHTPPGVSEALAKLPKDKADQARAAFESIKADRQAHWQEKRAHHEELRAILTASEFDKAAFLKKHEEMNAMHAQKHQKHAQAIADLAAGFNQEERRILAEAMPGHGKHKMHRCGMGKGGMDAPPSAPVAE